MRLLVTGSRTWTDRAMVFDALDTWHNTLGISVLIEGCAKGADALAEEWADLRRVPNQHFPADWTTFGKSAGARRNSRMLVDGEPELVLAFHDELWRGGGTADMVKKAQKWGLEPIVLSHAEPVVKGEGGA